MSQNVEHLHKVKLPKDNVHLSTAFDLCDAITHKGYSALVVGGAVRDLVMGKLINDADIGTNMPIDVLSQNFKVSSNNGESHGTVLVHFKGEVYEVTQYRTESTYSDGRHPDEVKPAETFYEDSLRRDFTINAMGLLRLNEDTGEVVDYHGGMDDIRKKVLNCVGNAHDRFGEDYLRMVRALRFCARYSFAISTDMTNAILQLKDKLVNISRERITAEIQKVSSYGTEAFELFVYFVKRVKATEYVFGVHAQMLDEEFLVDKLPKNATLAQMLYTVNMYYDTELLKKLKFDNKFVSEYSYYKRYSSDKLSPAMFREAYKKGNIHQLIQVQQNLFLKQRFEIMLERYEANAERMEEMIENLNNLLKSMDINGREFGKLRDEMFNVAFEYL